MSIKGIKDPNACMCVCVCVKDPFSAGIKPKESKKEFFFLFGVSMSWGGERGTVQHAIKKNRFTPKPFNQK